MERRAFLALLASAPIAAVAPLPNVLEQPRQFRSIITNASRAREVFILSGGTTYVYGGQWTTLDYQAFD